MGLTVVKEWECGGLGVRRVKYQASQDFIPGDLFLLNCCLEHQSYLAEYVMATGPLDLTSQ
jgi:hypothetical protein